MVLAACGQSEISEAELEASVARQLAEEVGQPEPDIDCPGPLEAEVGAEMECDLSVEGDDAVYPVFVEVTSVEDGTANYTVEVGDSPSSGGEPVEQEGDAPVEEDGDPIEEGGEPPPADGDPYP